MAFCRNCGTMIENDICPNCGTANVPVENGPPPVYTQAPPPPPPPPAYSAPQPPYGYGQPYGYPPSPYPPQPPKGEPIPVLGWVWRFLIPCIPGVGWIINLVMLFIWMGDTTKEESFRNWAKAQLIMTAIAVGLAIVFFFLFIYLGIALTETLLY